MIDTEKLRARIKSHGAVDWQTSHQLLDCFDEIDRLRAENTERKQYARLAVEKLRVAVETLKYYGNHMNYSIDHETSQMGFSRRCILYGDIEQRNEMTGLAGQRAREALKEIEGMK